MSEAKHTPTPWYDDGYRVYAPTEDPNNPNKREARIIFEYKHTDDFNDVDAPFIVKAVNCHDELVDMVECAIAAMDGEWGGDSRIVQRLGAQLAKIKA